MNLLARKSESEPVDLTEPLEVRLLRYRLRRIGELLEELPQVDLSRHQRDQFGNILHMTGKERAHLRARDQLEVLQRTTTNKVEDLTRGSDPAKQAEIEATLDKYERERRTSARLQTERCLEQGLWQEFAQRYILQAFCREDISADLFKTPRPQ